MTPAKHKRRRQHRRQVTVVGNRVLGSEEAAAIRLEMSQRFRASQERMGLSRMLRRAERIETLPRERRSVERAMLAVEERFVKALRVLELALPNEGARGYSVLNGLEYLREHEDHFLAGKWVQEAPRPGLPSGKLIDEARRIQGWVCFLDEREARVLTAAALSKRGDAGRKIAWSWVKTRLPETEGYTIRTLQGIYTGALRAIATGLTMQRLSA